MSNMFYGEDISYWLELERRFNNNPDSLEAKALLKEVVYLRGKLNFFQSRIKQMAAENVE